MGDNAFWKERYFYILVILILGSYTFSGYIGKTLADNIICNDRIRQTSDEQIAADLQKRVDVINKEVADKLDKIQQDITTIKVSIARLTPYHQEK